jgi:hypothetical protein
VCGNRCHTTSRNSKPSTIPSNCASKLWTDSGYNGRFRTWVISTWLIGTLRSSSIRKLLRSSSRFVMCDIERQVSTKLLAITSSSDRVAYASRRSQMLLHQAGCVPVLQRARSWPHPAAAPHVQVLVQGRSNARHRPRIWSRCSPPPRAGKCMSLSSTVPSWGLYQCS